MISAQYYGARVNNILLEYCFLGWGSWTSVASDHWAAHAESVLAARDVAATRCCLSNPSRRTAVCGKRENNDKDIQLDDVDVIG